MLNDKVTCFEERAGHVFILPKGLDRLKVTYKISFVEVGYKMQKTLSGVQENVVSRLFSYLKTI